MSINAKSKAATSRMSIQQLADATAKEITESVEVQTAEQVRVETRLLDAGKALVSSIGDVAGKYLALVMVVREEKIMPKQATKVLLGLGFKKTRVSEVCRVAFASDEVFSKYQARLIGFDNALVLARIEANGDKAALTPAGVLLLKDGAITDEESEDVLDGEGDSAEGKSVKAKKKSKSIAVLLREAANFLIVNSKKGQIYEFGALGAVHVQIPADRFAKKS